MQPDEVRNRAASESAWVAEQEATARKFGVEFPPVVKEALGRLNGLAQVVLAATPGLGAGLDAQKRVAELEGVAESFANFRASTREQLAHARSMADGIEQRLAQLLDTMTEAQEPKNVIVQAWEDARDDEQGAPSNAAGPGEPNPEAQGKCAPFDGRIFHGLVLVNDVGEMRIFSETHKDQFQVQAVAPDGETAGEPWSTMPSAWKSPPWSACAKPIKAKPALPRWDEPSTKPPRKVQMTIEGSGPATTDKAPEKPTAPVDNRKRIGDFELAADKATEYANQLSAEYGEAVDAEDVLAFFRTWRDKNADKSVPNPGNAFWHAAAREFKQTD